MEGDGFLASSPESEIRALLREATLMLAGKRDIPHDFFPTLLGRVAPEDLPGYSAHELAALTEASFENLKHRVPDKPKIRVENPIPVAGAKRLQAITIIEIINDDMPFLLDSVMGELNEQGVVVRLVAHPIITVERDQ